MLFFILLATVLVANAYGAENPCKDGWIYNYGACLKRFDTPKSFNDARAACKKENGDLVRIRGAHENRLVTRMVMSKRAVWIGFWDAKKDKKYTYVDGGPMRFSNWYRGEPSNTGGNEHCASLYGSSGPRTGKWNDAPCGAALPFVCAIERCPGGFRFYQPDNICIGVRLSPRPFKIARKACQYYGGDLMQIKNPSQTNFILSYLKPARYWMGVFDDDNNQKFNYIDGSELGAFKPWNKGEPNNYGGNEHCGVLYTFGPGRGKWNDATCSNAYPYICSSPNRIVKSKKVCAAGWRYFQPANMCVKVYYTPQTFHTARRTCLSAKGNLMMIKNDAQKDFVLASKPTAAYWIGVQDLNRDKRFNYMDGSSVGAYHPWASGEPNNWGGVEYCVQLVGAGPKKGQWNDAPCQRRMPFVCSQN